MSKIDIIGFTLNARDVESVRVEINVECS